MSTYFYFECLDHDPPLASEDEISQHDDEYLERAVRLAQGEEIDPLEDAYDIGGYFHRNALKFLRQHRTCAVGVVSEYGVHRPIPGREKRDETRSETAKAVLDRVRALIAAEATRVGMIPVLSEVEREFGVGQ